MVSARPVRLDPFADAGDLRPGRQHVHVRERHDAEQNAPNQPIYLRNLNHNPLDLGDNSSIPDKGTTLTGYWSPLQSWWGFPTWRETLSVNWTDPTRQVNDIMNFSAFGQPNGLTPYPASQVPVLDPNGQLLPWTSTPGDVNHQGPLPAGFDYSIIRRTPQLFSDAVNYKNNQSVFLGIGAGRSTRSGW